MNEIEVRAATPDDANAVAVYHDRCFAGTYSGQLLAGQLEAPSVDDTRNQLGDWFRPGSGFETLVAVVAGEPIGHVTISGAHLVHLFVDPGHHGTGVGRHLLALGEAMIARSGHADMELHARIDNVAAIAFYEAAGWTVTERVIHTVEHGIAYHEHVLVKHHP